MATRTVISTLQKPLSVVHVVETCCGGVATFVALLMKSQMADPMFGQIHLLHDGKGTEEKVLSLPHSVGTYASSRNPLCAFSIARDLHQKLTHIDADIVILHSSFPGFWGRMFRGRWKTIYCSHGWAFSQDFHSLSCIVYEKIEAILSHRCDAIVSISHDEFRVGHAAGVRDDIHEVIRHGLPAPPPAEDLPLDIKPGSLNLAFVGRFERQKGLDILGEIFEDPRLGHITLWLAGGDYRGVQDQKIPEGPNIHRLGWLKEGQIVSLLRQVDALIMPSRSEGFGLAALEAMRNRKAVIASGVGGLPELITDGVNGRIIDVTDIEQCRTVLASLSKADLSTMGDAALEIFDREFRWDVCYGKWRSLMARLTGR